MRNATQPLSWCLALAFSLLIVSAQGLRAEDEPTPGDVALAERLADTARLTLSTRTITDSHLRMAAALLEGAVKLNPAETRYSRLWAEAMLKVGDKAGAIKALNAYVLYEPEDRGALIQLTDLHAAEFETIDKRLDYLRDWVDDARLPEEVRSHIAIQAYAAYVERSQIPQAKSMLEQALKLNPLNMEALRIRFDQNAADGTPYERVSTLLAILKSNPNQFPYVARLARELALAGLAPQSLQFYGIGYNLAVRQGIAVPREYAVQYATELLLMNQAVAARQLIDPLVSSDPNDYDSVALKLLMERATDQKDAAAKTVLRMQNVLLNRLQMARQKFGDKGATTRPVDDASPVAWGSFDADAKALAALGAEEAAPQKASYVSLLTEIAWVDIYFRQSPGDAKPIIEALKKLVPENDAAVARLEGWSFLLRGENDEARVKLSAIKDKDEVAEAGLVRMLDTAASQKAGEKLLAKHPVGLNAVLILDALRDRKVILAPDPEASAPITEALGAFPNAWLAILDQPQNFYVLKAEPLKIPHVFGEPMLVRVSVQNISEYPITIGADGVLHQDLLFGVEFRGVVQQNIVGAVYDRIAHEIVLKPHASLSQMVRIDEGQVAQVLASSPFPAMQMIVRVRTNPTAAGVAPGGQMVQGARFIERSAFALSQDSLQKLSVALQQGGPAEKIVKIDLAATIAVILSQQKTEDMQRISLQLVELLRGLTRDPSAPVAAWAGGTLARISPVQNRGIAVSGLTNDPYWPARLLGLAAMGPMKLEEQRASAQQVAAHDTDPIVVSYAKALDELVQYAMTQVPQTQPSTTQPTTAPTATDVPAPGQSPFNLNPIAPPTTKPVGPDVIIPPLPLTLPPGPNTKP